MAGKEWFPERNAEIRRRVAAGERQKDVAAEFGLTAARVSDIVHPERVRARQLARLHRLYAVDKDFTERCRAASRAYQARKREAAHA
jgi:transcriptional regulator with XRE-family HTH domain